MTRWLALAGALALAAGLPAGELRIAGDTSVPAHRLVRLWSDGAEPDAAVLWDVFPEDAADVEEHGGRLLFAAPPGVYKVKLRTIKGQKVQTARVTVTVGGAGPPTPPTPGPAPAESVWLVVVEETAERTPAAARLLGDLAFWRSLEGQGHRWRIYDRDNPAVREKGYDRAAAAAGGLPALLVLSPGGKVLKAVRLPDGPDGVKTLLREVTGK